ncbi:MAG: S9 family peptidase [Robiginitomaculum sp.]|nr:S9 family peptidase [Robiginitomaculum sp.]
MKKLFVAFCLFGLLASMPANAKVPPISAFAEDQEISSMTISPNGKLLAFFRIENGKPAVFVKEVSGAVISGGKLPGLKPSGIRWVGNDYLLIIVRKTKVDSRLEVGNRVVEVSRTYSLNIKTKKIIPVLTNASANLSDYNNNLGSILAVDHEAGVAFIPGYNESFHYDIYKVDPKSGNGFVHAHGIRHSGQWILNSKNEPTVRAFRNQRLQKFEIQRRDDKSWPAIYKEDGTDLLTYSLVGLNMDETALIVRKVTDAVPFSTLYEMDLKTGDVSKPIVRVDGFDLGGTIRDPYTNLIIGVSWTEDQDEYHWFDKELGDIYHGLKLALAGNAVRLNSWSKDRKNFVISFAKPGKPVRYAVYNTDKMSLKIVASSRPKLAKASLGTISGYSFEARDGKKIPAYLTLPPGNKKTGLPLVVLPHGGPEARDSANFDWLTQMIASRGYAVFQPNFRGSDGYGWEFTKAGWGEWGKGMQHDVTDGVKDLIAKGIVDPDKICIAGASYGGYAAMAGATFTPDLYKCAVSIAGVFDLKAMYDWAKINSGRRSGTVAYWDRSMSGDEHRETTMRAASPIRFANQVKIPVLLIHGRDDTIVPIVQSKRMNGALKRNGVDVTLIEQKMRITG